MSPRFACNQVLRLAALGALGVVLTGAPQAWAECPIPSEEFKPDPRFTSQFLIGKCRFKDEGRRFDAIVLDPPKFAPTVAHAERAARAYKDINRLALGLLEPGGVLFTYSCSGGIAPDLFHKIVAGAGIDAGVDGYIVQRTGAAPDHPMTIEFPEGDYLKGLVVMRR